MFTPTLAQPNANLPKVLLSSSSLLLISSLVFGFLNLSKVGSLRSDLRAMISAREISERARVESEKNLKTRESALSAAEGKAVAAEAKVHAAETELSKAQEEKAQIESRLQASEAQVVDLQKRVAEATISQGAGGSAAASSDELQSVLEATKKQLEIAEQEKAIFADKLKAAESRLTAIEEEKKRRESGLKTVGIRGTVLAVNQSYNFVVLNLGDRQGVVLNSEMLVMRRGTFIGKIRISSVEPTTSIGDIITSSLARGVQVQLGDTVIYAGNTNS
jgi:flagellar biosynthesis chaperone FliJ